jgi:hypothetical protein
MKVLIATEVDCSHQICELNIRDRIMDQIPCTRGTAPLNS